LRPGRQLLSRLGRRARQLDRAGQRDALGLRPHLRSIRTDQTAALALGIDVPRYKLYAFLIGAAFASIAGSLLAFDFQFLSPDMVSTQQSFLIVTMLVIGGEATLVGPVIGVVLLTLLRRLPVLGELQDARVGHLARRRDALLPERPLWRLHLARAARFRRQ